MVTPEIIMVMIGVILAVILGLFTSTKKQNTKKQNTYDEQTDTQVVTNIIQRIKWVNTYHNTKQLNSVNTERFISGQILTLIDTTLIPLPNETFITYMNRLVPVNVKDGSIDKRLIKGLYITLYIGYTHLHITRDKIIELIVNITDNGSIHNNIIRNIQSLPNWESLYNDELAKNTFYNPSGNNKVLSAAEVQEHISN